MKIYLTHDYWMSFALKEAEKALEENEIPVGAILVKESSIIAQNHNRTRQMSDPTAHAEKLVIEEIISKGEKYLYDFTLYVTLEPCSMCAGTIVLARVGTVVFGAFDGKTGAVGSLYNIPADRQLNHNPKIIRGVKSTECSELLKEFFKSKR
ncbi:MAG: tRNA adenosine(34) deaminase TadA [Candidatus Cloacimonas sp.]|nr:tRNA adenosine(34) deaminase TadA [Candidatus Cloacimonadota bacterium]